MTCNIVLISDCGRPRLLDQTLRTLYENTPHDQFNLTIVDDGDNPPLRLVMSERHHHTNISVVRISPACHIIGRLKNAGAYWSEKQFGRGEWLCFLDDDMALFPDWLGRMSYALDCYSSPDCNLRVLGGIRHPYHGVNGRATSLDVTDAVAGYCHFMRWSTWDRYGPYDAHAVGTGQSEDWKICNDIVKDGEKVGYIHPPVMAHCGVTASNGKPAIGSEAIVKVPGVLYL